MLNLPPAPAVFNTRHLTCVTCKERFVIAEGYRNHRRELPPASPTVSTWFNNNRQQLPAVPPLHSAQQPVSNTLPLEKKYDQQEINCPRCGADNRNWLYLNNSSTRSALQPLFVWLERMPRIGALFIWGMLLLILVAVAAFIKALPPLHAIALGIAIPFFMWAIFWDFTHKWKKFRDDSLLYKHKLTTKNPDLVLQLRGAFLIFFLAFVLPFIFVSALPRAFNFALEFVRETPDETVSEAVTDAELETNQQLEESKESLEAILEEIQAFVARIPEEVSPQIEEEAESLAQDLNVVITDATKEIDDSIANTTEAFANQRDEELAAVEAAREDALTDFSEEFLAELRTLVIWGGLMGAAALITVMATYSNLKEFIQKVNAQVPKPIYHSVAGMTRLATWEAQKALEIHEEYIERVQWVSVKRNEAGGIDLVGLFRDPPQFDSFGQAKGGKVRAQRHEIQTDEWCRVVNAKIDDVEVPIPAGAPAGVMALPERQDVAAPIRIRLP